MRQISCAILAALCLAATASAATMETSRHVPGRYRVAILSSLGGSISRGNSINDLGFVAGYSFTAGNAVRHATLWGLGHTFDLGSLGGPGANSSVPWPVKNVVGIVSGITETGETNPLGETWSCGGFLGTSGTNCVGFVWQWGVMHPLPTLGGYNGFATGTNNWGETVGWAENLIHDPTCAADSDQKLQFRPVVWGPDPRRIRALPLIAGDTSGAATAINDRGEIVGISGTCDQAQGRRTAKHAVRWDAEGHVHDLGNIGADVWNTPMAINERGDIVGFAATDPTDLDGNFLHAFAKFRDRPIQDLGALPGDVSSVATGVNVWNQVVGYSSDAAGDFRAFFWQDGTMVDLASLAPDFDGDLVLAMDINDFGQITGRAVDPDSGEGVTFVATPVLRPH